MAITVETGSGLANAESYISVAEANSYHSLRGNTTWATITTEQAEQALRRATDYLQQVYGGLWHGYKTTDTQALDWPRKYVPRTDVTSTNYYVETFIPQELKNACAEMAWKAAQGNLAPDLTQGIKREKVGILEVEYDSYSVQYTRYRSVDNILNPLLKFANGGAWRPAHRV